MTEQDFARGLLQEVVEGNARIYDDLFRSTTPAGSSDPYWKAAAGLFTALGEEQRRVFLRVLRQVTVDAVSSTLAILDGVSTLPGQEAELQLRHGDEVLGDALQDHFLAEAEAV